VAEGKNYHILAVVFDILEDTLASHNIYRYFITPHKDKPRCYRQQIHIAKNDRKNKRDKKNWKSNLIKVLKKS